MASGVCHVGHHTMGQDQQDGILLGTQGGAAPWGPFRVAAPRSRQAPKSTSQPSPSDSLTVDTPEPWFPSVSGVLLLKPKSYATVTVNLSLCPIPAPSPSAGVTSHGWGLRWGASSC